MRLDLADLKLFLCVVEAGSITGGAQRAHLALASASERLRRIEDNAGVSLLHRHARGVLTTEAGEALAHHARLMLAQQTKLQDDLQDFAVGARGTLRLYANTAALTQFLPQRLAPWLAARPALRVELKERTSADIVRAISVGLVEAGIVSDAVQAPDTVTRQPVMRDDLVLIVPSGHARVGRAKVRLSEVSREPFVGLAPGNALQDHIDEHAQAGKHPLRLRIRMKTFEGLCEMVAHGVGLGIVPSGIAQRGQRRHGYQTLALDEKWATRHLCLCFREAGTLSSPMRSLMDHLGATFVSNGG